MKLPHRAFSQPQKSGGALPRIAATNLDMADTVVTGNRKAVLRNWVLDPTLDELSMPAPGRAYRIRHLFFTATMQAANSTGRWRLLFANANALTSQIVHNLCTNFDAEALSQDVSCGLNYRPDTAWMDNFGITQSGVNHVNYGVLPDVIWPGNYGVLLNSSLGAAGLLVSATACIEYYPDQT